MKAAFQISLYVIFLSICVCSCQHKPYPRSMQIADSIVDTAPDSAVALLAQLKDSILSEPKSTCMYYKLLSIKAKDKAYIPHTSDSLILQVIHYYEQREDHKHLPEAYYYAGRTYRDLGDAPQALDYFQKAVDKIGKGNDYKLYSRMYSQMGTLYMYQDMYEEALKASKKANYYDILARDSTAIIFNLRNIGLSFTGINNADSALFYYSKAHEQAKLIGNQDLMDMLKIDLASLYKQLKRYDSAKIELQQLFNPGKKIRQSTIYTIYADLLYQMQNLDSASYYYNQLLEIGTVYAKKVAHWKLAKISQSHNNNRMLMEHIQKYMDYTDSIQKKTDTETIYKMQSLYNYQLREKENSKLRIHNAQQQLYITYTIFGVIIVIAFITIYIQYSSRKKHQLNEQLNKLKKIQEEQYLKSTKFIEANKIQMQKLEDKLQNSTIENSTLLALLQIQKEQIMQMNCKIETDRKEQEIAEIAFKQSSIYNRFHKAINDAKIKLTSEDWNALQSQIDNCYKDFTTRLRALYPISEIELQICLLLKANITTTGIAQLTGRSKSAIVSARKKLYEKIHNQSGKAEEWDAFIATF
ncbi:tetratricopeptide repeat protein [Bacteroides sp.]|uniref:tetratricopeptide repeat protein n=1 Tax=Bacteroides sp. TaxID=29523 RepID=UPI00262689C1|nr:tetratricopeptide repeat protein [Bacteroides sp.]